MDGEEGRVKKGKKEREGGREKGKEKKRDEKRERIFYFLQD